MWLGQGAGGAPTATAVLGDVLDAARNRVSGRHDAPFRVVGDLTRRAGRRAAARLLPQRRRGRPTRRARRGRRASSARHGVSIRSMEQSGFGDEARLDFLTHDALHRRRRRDDRRARRGSTSVDSIGACLRVIEGTRRDRLGAACCAEYAEWFDLDRRRGRRHAPRGQHAAAARRPALRAPGRRRLAQVRGPQPHGVVQGPRHDDGDHQGQGPGGHDRSICGSTGNTSASAAAYAAQGRDGLRRARARGQDRPGQAGPGDGLRRRRCSRSAATSTRPSTSRARSPEHLPVTIVNSINPDRIEGQKTGAFEIVDALGRAPDVLAIPVGNAGNITAYWRGFTQYHDAGRVHDPAQMWGFQAAGRGARSCSGHPVEQPRDHRHRDPHRQPRELGHARSRSSTSRSATSARSPTTRSSTRTTTWRATSRSSASRRRRRRVAGAPQATACPRARRSCAC